MVEDGRSWLEIADWFGCTEVEVKRWNHYVKDLEDFRRGLRKRPRRPTFTRSRRVPPWLKEKDLPPLTACADENFRPTSRPCSNCGLPFKTTPDRRRLCQLCYVGKVLSRSASPEV